MKRLLTFEDLTNFYLNKYKKTVHFDASKTGEPIVVQTKGSIVFEKTDEKDIAEGLTKVRLQACHTDRNLNSSSVSYDVMSNRFLPTFKNRPILGYIHEVNGEPCFYGHNIHIEETNEGEDIVYDEIPVGIIPETNNAELVFDEKANHYNVFVDGYIFNEYTKAAEILEREQELAVSVELSLNAFSYNPKEKLLVIEDGYFSGVTILQCDDNGNEVKPGMAGSNIKLQDFSESNNSLFSSITDEENSKLIETLEKLNSTLEKFNINENSKEGGQRTLTENKLNELLSKYGKTQEELTFEIEGLSDEELEAKFVETFADEEPTSDDTKKDEGVVTPDTEVVEEGEPEAQTAEEPEADNSVTEEPAEDNSEDNGEDDGDTEDFKCKKKNSEEDPEATEDEACKPKKKCEEDEVKFTKTFSLSHEDIRSGLYALLSSYEESDNDWYFINETFDDNFTYEGLFTGKIWNQKYTKDGDNITFEGERTELFRMLLTESEKVEIETLRSNYSLISEKLSKYEAAELKAEKEAIFADEAYAEFIESEGFKSIRENMDTYSVDELRNACELQFAKEIRTKKNFSLEKPVEEKKKNIPTMFAFAKQETDNSFLDGLLKSAKKK